MKQGSLGSVLETLNKDFGRQELLESLKADPPHAGTYPLADLKQLSSHIKQKYLSIVQSTLKQLCSKFKFPGLHYSPRSIIMLNHLCIINNASHCYTTFGFLEHFIRKVHLYSVDCLGRQTTGLMYANVLYLSTILDDLLPIIFERGGFVIVFGAILRTVEAASNSMQVVCLWVLIKKAYDNLDFDVREQLNQLVLGKSKFGQLWSLLGLIGASPIDIEFLVILRKQESNLNKYLLFAEGNSLRQQGDTDYVWPEQVLEAYKTTPQVSRQGLTLSKSLGETYSGLCMLEVYCNSPHIEYLEQHLSGGCLKVFVKFVSGDDFLEAGQPPKLWKWILTLRQMEILYTESKHLNDVQQDLLYLFKG